MKYNFNGEKKRWLQISGFCLYWSKKGWKSIQINVHNKNIWQDWELNPGPRNSSQALQLCYCGQYQLFISFPTYFDALLHVCIGVYSHTCNYTDYYFWAALNKTDKFNPLTYYLQYTAALQYILSISHVLFQIPLQAMTVHNITAIRPVFIPSFRGVKQRRVIRTPVHQRFNSQLMPVPNFS